MESRNVNVRISSSIRHPEQDEEIHEVLATGQYVIKAGKPYLKYVEEQDGNGVQTIIKMGTEDALIMRSGAVDMRLPFSLEGERLGTYGNGPARFDLGVKTGRLEFAEQEDAFGGRFRVMYTLLAEGSILGKYELTITYTEGIS